MQPEEKGRHCAACQKTVVDFTAMSDAEVVAYMSRAGSNICGRFAPDQLGRKLEEPAPLKRSRWLGWQLVLTGALLTADGSRELTSVKGMIDIERVEEKPTMGKPVPKIVADTLEETKIDTVECHGEEMGIVMVVPDTAILGKMGIPVKDTMLAKGTIVADTKPPTIDSSRVSVADTEKWAVQGEVKPLMGDTIIRTSVDTAKVSAFDSIRQLLADTLTKLNLLPAPKALMLYPNPVPRGASFRIAWPEEAGTYQAALYTIGGRLIQQRSITVSGPGQQDEWPLPASAAAGVYVLQVRGKGSRFTQKVVVQ